MKNRRGESCGAPETRWKFYDPALLWLFPVTLVFHLLEEWSADAPILLWTARLDAPQGMLTFVIPNMLGLTLTIIGLRLVRHSPRFHWIVPALATATLLNTAGHMVGSALGGSYSAGMITAVIFWVPLGLLTLLRVASGSTARTLWGGMAVGAVIELTVTAVVEAIS